MLTKDIIREIKNAKQHNNFTAVYNRRYNSYKAILGWPGGNAFNNIVKDTILELVPSLVLVLGDLNSNTANAVASKLIKD